MVFTNLGSHEKEAFFDLLDEYFSTRPDLLKSLGSSGETSLGGTAFNNKAATSAVHKALASNPQATASIVSAGLRHGSQNSAVKSSPFASAASNPAIANSVGRVAAASLAFGQRNENSSPSPPAPRNNAPPPPARSNAPPPPATRAMPPALPRRTSSTSTSQVAEEEEQEEDNDAPPPPSRTPSASKASGIGGLTAGKSFGDVDMTSWKSGIMSVKNGTKNKLKPPPALAPPIPSAFPKRQNAFAPPPMRRVSTNESIPTRNPEPEPEPEDDSEWAEALYDYNSGEAGDLVLEAQQRVKIVSRDSDDWWTGEVNGKSGLFPASYVRAL